MFLEDFIPGFSWLIIQHHSLPFQKSLVCPVINIFFIQNGLLSLFPEERPKQQQLCALPTLMKFFCPMLIYYLHCLRPALLILLVFFKSHFSCKPSSTELKITSSSIKELYYIIKLFS